MAYTNAELRTLVRDFARNASDSTQYPDTRIDRAIQVAADQWQRIVKAPRALSSMTLTLNSAMLPTLPTGFIPEANLSMSLLHPTGTIIDPSLQVVSYDELLRRKMERGTTITGQPTHICFTSATAGLAFPTPDMAYVISCWFWKSFDITSPNLPDDHLRQICALGAPAELQKSEPENRAWAQQQKGEFIAAAKLYRAQDAGGRGALVAVHDEPAVRNSWYPVG